jgi:hypothetical protein
LDNWTKYRYALGEAAMAEYTAKTEKLDTIFTLKEVRFNWFTIVASIGKKNYYTFYDSLPFSNQLTKHDLTTWKLGLLWNYFSQNSISNHATYLNIGIARMEDNNTNLLSTKDVNEETAIKNSGGDTVRKISKTYKAYTDNVSDTSQWMVSANFYFLFGKRTSGFHIFPSLYMPDGLTGYFNGGVGYIVSFINNKKDQPVINAEGYIQFNDVFNSLKVSTNFLKRNEIGIRFVFPIALLSK